MSVMFNNSKYVPQFQAREQALVTSGQHQGKTVEIVEEKAGNVFLVVFRQCTTYLGESKLAWVSIPAGELVRVATKLNS